KPDAGAAAAGWRRAAHWCRASETPARRGTWRRPLTSPRAGTASRHPRRARTRRPEMAVGFFTDTTLCIGCKACEVACKQWNQLPDDGLLFTGMSYDNTGHLGASTWRHVSFIERPVPLT